MALVFLGFDIEPAVIAQRCLVHEAHILAEIYDLVWTPTAEILDQLSRVMPPSLTCFAGKQYAPDKTKGALRDVYLMLPNRDKSVIYLLSAVTRFQAESSWRSNIRRAQLNRQKDTVALLKQRGPMSIVRDSFMCSVPVDTEELDEVALQAAIRSYLRTLEPDLAALSLGWLPHDTALELEARIQDEARQLARQQTEGQRLQLFLRSEA